MRVSVQAFSDNAGAKSNHRKSNRDEAEKWPSECTCVVVLMFLSVSCVGRRKKREKEKLLCGQEEG